MTEKQLNYWKRKRAKGKHSFVIWHGVIGWGLLSATLVNLINYFYPYRPFSIESVVTTYLMFPALGFFFGVFMWNIQERQFRRAQQTLDTKEHR